MIFASDLDRTLIYSKRFVTQGLEEDLVPVELYKDEVMSYMTKKSIEILKEIAFKYMFIPVTTRTIEQYLKINIFNDNTLNKYAVTTNGGSILINRKLDIEWKNIMDKELRECEAISKVMETHKRMIKDHFVLKTRVADEKFFYNVVELDKFDYSCLYEFDEYLKENGWKIYIQGRKIYYIPSVLTKSNALRHIMERENITNIIASGDSLLDLSMLKIANRGFVPSHGELVSLLNDKLREHIHVTVDNGFKATEEFLHNINGGANQIDN